MRLAFMGTPEFAVPTLQALLASQHSLQAVFTQPDRPSGRGEQLVPPLVKQLALKEEIPVFQPEVLKQSEWESVFRDLSVDAFVVVAYGKILRPWLLEIPKWGAYNVHASLLPKYRGAAPIAWAIANGESVTGITTMKLDAGLDTGDILLQKAVQIEATDTAADLHHRLSLLGATLMIETLDGLERGVLRPIPQDSGLASHAPMLKKSDGEIHWDDAADVIANRIRAFNPWPGTYTSFRGQILKIWKARSTKILLGESYPAGSLLYHDAHQLLVTCGRGFLQLDEVQLQNRRRTSALDFVHGVRLAKNQHLVLGR